jgi:hypothetical protein
MGEASACGNEGAWEDELNNKSEKVGKWGARVRGEARRRVMGYWGETPTPQYPSTRLSPVPRTSVSHFRLWLCLVLTESR